METLNERQKKVFEKTLDEFDELEKLLDSVEIMSDHKLYNFYLKKKKNIEELALVLKQIKELDTELEEYGQVGADAELEELERQKDECIRKAKQILASGKIMQEEKATIEISSKTDSEFVDYLCELINKFAASDGLNFEKKNEEGATIVLSGVGAYEKIKNFSGKIKKVNRGEESEAIVAVIKSNEEDFELDEKDLTIQTSKSSGAGGQHINKTESAVKIIHNPTGISAECQDERSQTKNKEKAMALLVKKIAQSYAQKAQKDIEKQRKELKNKIFSTTPAILFDFDANKIVVSATKQAYRLNEDEMLKMFEDWLM